MTAVTEGGTTVRFLMSSGHHLWNSFNAPRALSHHAQGWTITRPCGCLFIPFGGSAPCVYSMRRCFVAAGRKSRLADRSSHGVALKAHDSFVERLDQSFTIREFLDRDVEQQL